MTTRQFIGRSLIITTASIACLVGINYAIDLYGLFRSTHNRDISIFSDERTSKYLLAHRYVPDNFDGYILGPSLSANLDPSIVPSPRIYNLSMMGANITEQKAVLDKAMERKIPQFVILCLHPYLTADHGMKTGMITPKEYYGALGSISLYKAYLLKFIRKQNLMPNKYPKNQFNSFGYNNYEVIVKKMPVKQKIEEQLSVKNAIDPYIDSTAWVEFNEMITMLTTSKVRIVAYFHPLPRPLFLKYEKDLEQFEDRMKGSLSGKATIINFNSPSYSSFTSNLDNYIDHGHLSEAGQHYILKEIINQSGLGD